MGHRIDSEEEFISRYLAPLSRGFAGAFGLTDDCAAVTPPPGHDLILTTDAVAEAVHFFPDDSPEDVAWKALAVNVSDLAGKAARPFVYLMALTFPEAPEEAWLERFIAGLARAQADFGLVLAGGDTDRRPGPMSVTVTAIGLVPTGRMLRRTTARPGDRIFVSGTLGDAALGLDLRRHPELSRRWALDAGECTHLLDRYRRPQPRLALAAALREFASSAMDVSDGLAKDLSRLCRASGCGARVEASRLPMSSGGLKAVAVEAARLGTVISGGDDYEILAAVPPHAAESFVAAAAREGVPVADIGAIVAGAGLTIIGVDGNPMQLEVTGWDHFARHQNIP